MPNIISQRPSKDGRLIMVGEPFVCKGDSVGTYNKGHPNATDLENAKAFAESIAAKI